MNREEGTVVELSGLHYEHRGGRGEKTGNLQSHTGKVKIGGGNVMEIQSFVTGA